jgi:hypothetical protein
MPLPAIEDVFQKLGNAGLFRVMDITKGFWNVPIAESLQKYTAFTLRNIGLFGYLVMGLKNLPATFVRLCKLVFPPEDFKTFLQCFLYDLYVFCKDFKELLPALDKVLKRIIFANLKLHPRKSHLAVEEVDYLGHTIFKGGVKVSKKKSKAVRALLPPRTFNELQKLIGVFQYFRTFIPNFSKIARSLTVMLSPAEPFVWSPACQSAFETLKEKTVLKTNSYSYRSDLQCILNCDYQGQTVAAMLGQRHPGKKVEQSIAYTSRTLTRAEQRYTTTEGELLALLHGLHAFRQYLAGRQLDSWCAPIIGRLSGSGSSISTQGGSRDGCTRSTLTLLLMSNIVQASCTRCQTDSRDCRRPTWEIAGASNWEATLKVISCPFFCLVGLSRLV